MTGDPLRELIVGAATPSAELDLSVLSARLRRRQLRRWAGRVVGRAALAIAVAAVLLPLAGVRPDPGPADVVLADADGLVELDAVAGPEAAHQPARLPAGYARCSGPAREGQLTVTRYCAPDRPLLLLQVGGHLALPEHGDELRVGARAATTSISRGVTQVTVSDDNSLDDTHLRLSAPGVSPTLLGAILESVPAIQDAPPTPVQRGG